MASALVGGRLFPRELLSEDTLAAARQLIGVRLVRGSGPNARSGRIVEVEAYIGQEDLASHARAGRTARNAVMFGPPGVAYVYLVYGMHHCLNIVTESDGRPAALLIRAVEPICGGEEMRAARLEWIRARTADRPDEDRRKALDRLAGLPVARLAAGPGLVCSAFSIDRADEGVDLCDSESDLRLEVAPDDEPVKTESGTRVGIDYAPEPWLSMPWRFYDPGSPSLSAAPTRRLGSAS
jgi:DNA-3-methyladenine glycosylase